MGCPSCVALQHNVHRLSSQNGPPLSHLDVSIILKGIKSKSHACRADHRIVSVVSSPAGKSEQGGCFARSPLCQKTCVRNNDDRSTIPAIRRRMPGGDARRDDPGGAHGPLHRCTALDDAGRPARGRGNPPRAGSRSRQPHQRRRRPGGIEFFLAKRRLAPAAVALAGLRSDSAFRQFPLPGPIMTRCLAPREQGARRFGPARNTRRRVLLLQAGRSR